MRGPGESLALGAPNVAVPCAVAAGEANGRRKVKSHVELCCCCRLAWCLLPAVFSVSIIPQSAVEGRWVGAETPNASLYAGATRDTSLKGALSLTGVPFLSEENGARDREVDSKRKPVWATQ